MATNESIMALPLASKFKAEARAMADRGLSTYEAVYQLNKLEEQDKPRADAIMALHEHKDYQPLLRAMANVPCIDVDTAKNILNMTIEQERPRLHQSLPQPLKTLWTCTAHKPYQLAWHTMAETQAMTATSIAY